MIGTESMLIIILIAIIIVLLLLLFCVAPQRLPEGQFSPFENTYIAHRGLFDNKGIPENSLAAFANAVQHEYGIELDVQLTLDGRLVVFHDETLDRMCGVSGLVSESSSEYLRTLSLAGTTEKIPFLDEVLELVQEKIPLVVEIKPEGRCIDCVRKTTELLESYDGIFCIESFNPLVCRWLKKNRPEIIRGQLSTSYFKDGLKVGFLQEFLLTNLLLDFLSRPNFIAFNIKYTSSPFFSICRKLFRPECVAWTVKSQGALDEARKDYQVFIFDSFLPR